jgi:hypothetical protein
MYVTKRSKSNGTIEILAKKPTITQALYQHIRALQDVGSSENIITVNPKGIIYGNGYDICHFKRNKKCVFCLRYGFQYGVDDV